MVHKLKTTPGSPSHFAPTLSVAYKDAPRPIRYPVINLLLSRVILHKYKQTWIWILLSALAHKWLHTTHIIVDLGVLHATLHLGIFPYQI